MISIAILTKNNSQTIKECLDSVKSFFEVVVVDSGSSDSTIEIAKDYQNVRFFFKPFTTFGDMRRFAASQASSDWILMLDSDEKLSLTAQEQLPKLTLQENCVYSFPFHNYFNGKWIKSCGWYPDRHIRLFNRKYTNYKDQAVHEALDLTKVSVSRLDCPIIHYSYRSFSDFSLKMHLYSDLFAQQYAGKRRSSIGKALLHGYFAFFKSYIIKRGIFSGWEGYIISKYIGQTAYYKYLKLYEINKSLP